MQYVFKDVGSLRLKGANVDIEIASLQMQWGVDAITQCVAVPVIGRETLPSNGVTQGPIMPVEGELYEIFTGSEEGGRKLFTGYIIGISSNSKAGGIGGGFSVGTQITLANSIMRLGAYTNSSRVFRVKSSVKGARPPGDEVGRSTYDAAVSALFTNAHIYEKSFNSSKYILKVMDDMVKYKEREPDKIPSDFMLPTEDVLALWFRRRMDPVTIASMVTQQYSNAWNGSNALTMLQSMIKTLFLNTVPVDMESAQYKITPLLPLAKNASYTLDKDQILGIVRQTNKGEAGILPVKRVWIPKPGNAFYDSSVPAGATGVISEYSTDYYTWPPEEVEGGPGNAIILNPPAFLMYSMTNERVYHGKTGDPKGVNATGYYPKLRDDGKNVISDEEKKDLIDPDAAEEMGTEIARMFFADNAFKQVTMSVTVPWHTITTHISKLGLIYKINIPYLLEKGQSEDTVYYGYLTGANLVMDTASNTINCTLSFSHVRSEELNELYGMDDHPVYGEATVIEKEDAEAKQTEGTDRTGVVAGASAGSNPAVNAAFSAIQATA